VAAPYVETAKALAIAAGLPRRWVQEVFRFAPKPDSCYHATDRNARVERGANVDYVDCFLGAIASGGHPIEPGQLRKQSIAYLTALEKRGRCRRFK
jgi:hypothetical protein